MLALRPRERYPLGTLREEMDRLFEEFLEDYPPLTRWEPFARTAYPPVNTWEDQDNLYVEAEIPGVAAGDLEISVAPGELTIKGERRAAPEPDDQVYHRRERPVGAFCRTIRLPVDVDAGRVEARLKGGVLTVTLPRAPSSRARTIKVEAAGR